MLLHSPLHSFLTFRGAVGEAGGGDGGLLAVFCLQCVCLCVCVLITVDLIVSVGVLFSFPTSFYCYFTAFAFETLNKDVVLSDILLSSTPNLPVVKVIAVIFVPNLGNLINERE